MQLRLSIIVPFYRVEPYIEKCIRTIYNQDIPQSEYEVICVDDCSPDGSRAIVERLQEEYSTLRLLVHTENKRQGGARNTGLMEAQGEYVWFIDSDDYIQSNCIQYLLTQAEKDDVDVLKFYFDNERGTRLKSQMTTTGVITGSEMVHEINTYEEMGEKCSSVCNQLIKRSFILTNNLFFAENVQYEDDDYAYQLYALASKVKVVPIAAYIVRVTPQSATRHANDYKRIIYMYQQALRMAANAPLLVRQDKRWGDLLNKHITYLIQQQVVREIKKRSTIERVMFCRENWKCHKVLRPFLSMKLYCSLWLIPFRSCFINKRT